MTSDRAISREIERLRGLNRVASEALARVELGYPPEYPQEVVELIDYLMRGPWLASGYDPQRAGEIMRSIETADLEGVCWMLTAIVRGERFCDGHWGAMISSGQLGAVIERLAQILEASGDAGRLAAHRQQSE